MKNEQQKSCVLLQEIQVPTWKWEDINMDFVVGLPHNQRQNDTIRAVVDRLTKYTNFIPVKSTYSVKEYERIYIKRL